MAGKSSFLSSFYRLDAIAATVWQWRSSLFCCGYCCCPPTSSSQQVGEATSSARLQVIHHQQGRRCGPVPATYYTAPALTSQTWLKVMRCMKKAIPSAHPPPHPIYLFGPGPVGPLSQLAL